MLVKNKILYSVICAMLFVMTFTTLTAFAADGDIVNKTYIGTYNNTDNTNSHFTIYNDSSKPIVAVTVYCNERGIYINGVGDMAGIDSKEFYANFPKVRRVNENGVIQGDNWIQGATIGGDVSTSGIFTKTITVKVTGPSSVTDRTFTKKG